MKKPGIKKLVIGALGVLIVGGIAGGSAYMGYLAGKDTQAQGAQEAEGVVESTRAYLEIIEDENGNISVKDRVLDINYPDYVETATRPWTEKIPVDCDEAKKLIDDAIRGKSGLNDLEDGARADLGFHIAVAKDVCSYEEYRNWLIGDLGKFLFTDSGIDPSAGDDGATSGGDVVDTATESTVTTADTTTDTTTPDGK
jgi:hypothetical protein